MTKSDILDSYKIDTLINSKFTPGTLALGCILQILEEGVLVSLPGGITGIVIFEEISDQLYKQHNERANLSKEVIFLRFIAQFLTNFNDNSLLNRC